MTQQDTRVALITGASSGIGKQAALVLAAQGFRIIGTGRDAGSMAAAEAEIRAAGNGDVTMLQADLSLLADARRLADEVKRLTPRLDLLLNNAGGMASDLVMTSEGLEANFAGNHLGPFLLTNLLLPLLRATAAKAAPGSVRILNTSSDASEMIPGVNLDDIQGLANFNVGAAYCRGKLANVLHARALAGRLAADGIVAHSYHPGAVDSNFFTYAPADTRERVKDLPKATEAEGADTLVWLATAEEPGQSSGLYWHKRALRTPNKLVEDADFVERFWQKSAELTGQA
ncbi:MAG TPA: SDR family NAD(P)-dependent oxidoreductase [Acidocella sp.]|jgi:NAD(P)-dependent dehydrogenase (short-subunit alcohol dehydrogenase family)|nr:SDR family NAD(P)-dependent oxidoreductase [Acidocella sp.]